MNKLGLADIQGLDAISWWPLPTAAWILLAAVVAAAIALILVVRWKEEKAHRWQRQMLNDLRNMEQAVSPESSTLVAAQLAEFLRRMAIHRFSRAACAALQGEAWLRWLKENDPGRFNWLEQGKFLLEAPYAPAGAVFDPNSIRSGIRAARKWVR